jgi:hypothetical protein
LSERGLPFIVLTGYTREQLRSEFSGGFFIEKPYRLTELIDGLSAMLKRRNRLINGWPLIGLQIINGSAPSGHAIEATKREGGVWKPISASEATNESK